MTKGLLIEAREKPGQALIPGSYEDSKVPQITEEQLETKAYKRQNYYKLQL